LPIVLSLFLDGRVRVTSENREAEHSCPASSFDHAGIYQTTRPV
jgi:hypothetical protein